MCSVPVACKVMLGVAFVSQRKYSKGRNLSGEGDILYPINWPRANQKGKRVRIL